MDILDRFIFKLDIVIGGATNNVKTLGFRRKQIAELQDRVSRHVVRNVFMVQWDGRRKLRHLFLFNDVLVCAKCKTNGGNRFLEVKWFIPLNEVVLNDPEARIEAINEQHPVKTTVLKSRAAAVREQIWKLERKQGPTGCQVGVSGTSRNIDKLKRKFSDLEAALMLHLPELPFKIGHKSNKMFYFFVSSDFERQQWIEAITALQQQAINTSSSQTPPTLLELNTCIAQAGNKNTLSNRVSDNKILIGELRLKSIRLQGGDSFQHAAIHVCFEVDSYGHFFQEGRTRTIQIENNEATFDDEISILMEGSQTLRILFYEDTTHGFLLRGKATFELTACPPEEFVDRSISLQDHTLSLSMKYIPEQGVISLDPDSKLVGNFGMKIEQVCKREKLKVPFLITCCIREVERRGLREVGIHRVSGSNSDVQKLRKAFENDPHEAQYMMRNVDINAVSHLLKQYLRELPEALFIEKLYTSFFEALSLTDPDEKSTQLSDLFNQLPECNRAIVNRLIDHMITINKREEDNKMSINNLATVFGPTLIRPSAASTNHDRDLLTHGTVDVMAQASILHFFLKRRQAEPEEVSHI